LGLVPLTHDSAAARTSKWEKQKVHKQDVLGVHHSEHVLVRRESVSRLGTPEGPHIPPLGTVFYEVQTHNVGGWSTYERSWVHVAAYPSIPRSHATARATAHPRALTSVARLTRIRK